MRDTREAMSTTTSAFLVLRGFATLVLALIAWACLGYFASMPLGLLYGWSGHPAIPDAPIGVYVGLYLIVLPLLCLFGAWRLVGLLGRALARRGERPAHSAR
jgi:hypothetical protein